MERLVDELVAQMESGSSPDYRRAMADLSDATKAGHRKALDAAIERLVPLLPGLAGDFARTAVLAGALMERGGSPMPLAKGLPERATEAMALNGLVPGFWKQAAPGRPLPEPVRDSMPELPEALGRLDWGLPP